MVYVECKLKYSVCVCVFVHINEGNVSQYNNVTH